MTPISKTYAEINRYLDYRIPDVDEDRRRQIAVTMVEIIIEREELAREEAIMAMRNYQEMMTKKGKSNE